MCVYVCVCLYVYIKWFLCPRIDMVKTNNNRSYSESIFLFFYFFLYFFSDYRISG